MELNSAPSKSFFERNWVKYGLIGGGIAILITVIFYLVDEVLLTNQMIGLISSIAILIIGMLAAVAQKRDRGGYITYGDAVATSIGSFMVSLVVSSVFSLLLFLVIDPSMMELLRNAQIEQMDKMLESGRISQERYDMSMKYIENMGSGGYVFNWSIAIIIAGVIALIVYLISSIFIRREPQP